MDQLNTEENRIKDAYRRRRESGADDHCFFAYQDLAHMARVQERHRETARLLAGQGIKSLAGLKILDVGCGNGNMLQLFLGWGANPEDLSGIELLEESAEAALNLTPNLDVRCGDASLLPWQDSQFDIVCQHTVFTSILDRNMKNAVAAEMRRVLRPGGAILWYDFSYDNPKNADVKGVKRREIAELFPGYTLRIKRITLAPFLARRIPSSILPVLYPLLSMMPFLSTSYLGLLIKPKT